jgi:hypothetical protein
MGEDIMKIGKQYLLSRSLPAALAALFLGLSPAFAEEAAGERWSFSDRIEGVWLVKVWLTNCATGETLPFPGATFDATAAFAGDGTFHDTNENNPILRSSSFGYWEYTGRRNYRFAFRLFRFDTTGLNIGSQIVRHNVVLSRDGKSYTSGGTAEFYDVNGIRMLPDGCSRSTATRFR